MLTILVHTFSNLVNIMKKLMNTKTRLQFISLAGGIALLTACGGGGSSGSTTITNSPTPIPNANNNTNNTNNTAVLPDANKTGIHGNIMTVGVGNIASTNTATAKTNEINKVIINGQTLDFTPNFTGLNLSTNTLTILDSKINSQVISRVGGGDRQLSYARYGYIKDGINGTPHLFAQGEVTTNMPTTGTATYTGNAAHVTSTNVSLLGARFKVNYGNKTISGVIDSKGSPVVNLSGTINGNTFSGTNQDISTQGYFYGNNAAELGGTYRNTNGSISGAYGAKK